MKILLSLLWTLAFVWGVTLITAHVIPSEHYAFAWSLTLIATYVTPLWWIWK